MAQARNLIQVLRSASGIRSINDIVKPDQLKMIGKGAFGSVYLAEIPILKATGTVSLNNYPLASRGNPFVCAQPETSPIEMKTVAIKYI